MTESVQSVSKSSAIQADQDPRKFRKILMNEPSQHAKVRSHTAETRQMMSARQMQKLIKNDEPVFLAVFRTSNDFVPRGKKNKGGNARSPNYAAVNSAHGMTQGQRRKLIRRLGQRKI